MPIPPADATPADAERLLILAHLNAKVVTLNKHGRNSCGCANHHAQAQLDEFLYAAQVLAAAHADIARGLHRGEG